MKASGQDFVGPIGFRIDATAVEQFAQELIAAPAVAHVCGRRCDANLRPGRSPVPPDISEKQGSFWWPAASANQPSRQS